MLVEFAFVPEIYYKEEGVCQGSNRIGSNRTNPIAQACIMLQYQLNPVRKLYAYLVSFQSTR